MTKKMLLLGAGVLLLISIPPRARAEDGLMNNTGGPAAPMASLTMLVKSAGLTPDQQSAVRHLLISNQAELAPLFERLHSLHERIASELLGPGSMSMSEIAPLQDRAHQIQERIDDRMLATALAIRNLMTADQRSRIIQANQQLQRHPRIEEVVR
jgi:hypothetical protein